MLARVPRLPVLFVLLGLWLGLGGAWAQGLQAIPPLSARVIDTTGTLQAGESARLEAKLQAFEQAQGTQIVVLMVGTTAPEDIADYTQRVGDAWKIGRKQVGDGLLLVIAKGERTLRIAPAKALEGAVPDLAARRVIDEAITPRFRQGDFAGGIEAGLDQLMRLIRGEGLPAPQRAPAPSNLPDWTSLLVFLFVAVPIAARVLSAMLGRKLGALLTGGAIGALAWVLGTGLALAALAALIGAVFALASSLAPRRGVSWGGGPGWGGGHGGWGGGGGFRSGGGGNFGGGGASGRW
jgi:uncharacterized protein